MLFLFVIRVATYVLLHVQPELLHFLGSLPSFRTSAVNLLYASCQRKDVDRRMFPLKLFTLVVVVYSLQSGQCTG